MRYTLTILLALATSPLFAQPHWGDQPDGGTLYFYTNTIGQDGAGETPTSEAIEVYKDGSATQLTTGATIDDDFDSGTGFHQIAIDTTQSGFDAGSFYTVVYSAGTSDSVSLTKRIIGSFYLVPAQGVTGVRNANMTYVAGTATNSALATAPTNFGSMVISAGGIVDASVEQWDDTNVASPDTAGYPKVTIKSGTGTGEVLLTSGKLTLADESIVSTTFATDAIDANAIANSAIGSDELASNAIGASELADSSIDAGAIAADAIGASELATDAIGAAEIAASAIANGTEATGFGTAQTGDGYALLNSGTFGLAVIEGQTDDIGTAGAGLTAIPWNASWDAEVESEVDDSLGGGTGTALTSIPWNASWDTEVQSEAADALTAYDPPTKAEMDTGFSTTLQADVAYDVTTTNGTLETTFESQ